jgi:uncharacterized protein
VDALKLVFAGPVGAGKTTAIRSISDTEPISTEMPLTDGPMGDKLTTTVGFDFSTVMLDEQTPLLVYGLPGQEHFAFMREIVLEGALGVVIVLNGSSDELIADCEYWIQSIQLISNDMPMVVGITQTEHVATFNLGSVRDSINRFGLCLPVLTFDARDSEQTANLVRALLVCLE